MHGDSDATFLLECSSCEHFDRIIIDLRGMKIDELSEKVAERMEERGWNTTRHYCPSCNKKNFPQK